MTVIRELAGLDDLLAVTGNDSHIRAIANRDRVVSTWLAASGATAWVASSSRVPGRLHATAYGSPAAAADLVVALREDAGLRIGSVTLPRTGDDHLPPSYALRPRAEWEWFVSSQVPPPQAHEDDIHWLASADDEVASFLQKWSPRHDAKPGGSGVLRWCGARDATGALVVVAAHVEYVDGVPHLASVATSGAYRGNGYGASITAWVTRALLDEGNDLVTLGMYSDNDVARRMYQRLGFVRQHEFTSGGLVVRDGGG